MGSTDRLQMMDFGYLMTNIKMPIMNMQDVFRK